MECIGDEMGERKGGSGRGRGWWLVRTVEEVVDVADTEGGRTGCQGLW